MSKAKELLDNFLDISRLEYSRYKSLQLKQFTAELQKLDSKTFVDFMILLSECIAGKDSLIHMSTDSRST